MAKKTKSKAITVSELLATQGDYVRYVYIYSRGTLQLADYRETAIEFYGDRQVASYTYSSGSLFVSVKGK